MEYTPEISAALDIYSEESTTTNEDGFILQIYSESKRIKSVLADLFNNNLDINTNLPMWTRNTCKYGDNFVYLKLDPEKGIVGCQQLPTIEIERHEVGVTAKITVDITQEKDENKKALKFYDLALKINPKFFMVLYNKSLALLKMLNFNEGWKLYEYRHTTYTTQNQELFQDFSKKKFQNAKNILILKEQGLGDFIMFSSILADLTQDGKNITVETDERVLPLMKRSFKKTSEFN
jgi:tetratricopeptide (TPR) repeat protein